LNSDGIADRQYAEVLIMRRFPRLLQMETGLFVGLFVSAGANVMGEVGKGYVLKDEVVPPMLWEGA